MIGLIGTVTQTQLVRTCGPGVLQAEKQCATLTGMAYVFCLQGKFCHLTAFLN
jgi:hypothetical protein